MSRFRGLRGTCHGNIVCDRGQDRDTKRALLPRSIELRDQPRKPGPLKAKLLSPFIMTSPKKCKADLRLGHLPSGLGPGDVASQAM